MWPTPIITWKFQQDRLQAAIAERIKYQGRSTRTFAQIVNTALFSVALKAQKYTPKADPAKIRAEMFVEVNFVINRAGKRVPARKGKKFRYGESQAPFDFNHPERIGLDPGLASHSELPLVMAIVLARANLSKIGRVTGTSLYNRLTNNRWFIDKAKLKSRATIYEYMERMVSARHSSSALLQAGWKAAIDILRPFIASNDIAGNGAGERFNYSKNQQRLGTARPAREGWKCSGMIENHVGGGGTALADRQRTALFKYGIGPTNRALAEETDAMLAKVAQWAARDAAAFNKAMKP